ncbi:MAG: class I SAM-dependent methyltransferase [Desulfomonile sp.]|nr:class I SAM-dependent methyltransferase [Desulfomonile sp.]
MSGQEKQTSLWEESCYSPMEIEKARDTAMRCYAGNPNRGGVAAASYKPLSSVWDGEDNELIEKMLNFYPKRPPRRILDATVNRGRFWIGSDRWVIGLDINGHHRPTVIGNNMKMPFRDGAFDVVVYDPPHIPNQGRDRLKDFTTRFGLGERSPKENGYNFSHFYGPFAAEAYRVLKQDGILLCKITDYVHHHRMQWAHIQVILAASSVGFQPCDYIVKIRKGPIIDPRWKKAHHARRRHCFWLVFRKSNKCE